MEVMIMPPQLAPFMAMASSPRATTRSAPAQCRHPLHVSLSGEGSVSMLAPESILNSMIRHCSMHCAAGSFGE